jgi:hypothetical protein
LRSIGLKNGRIFNERDYYRARTWMATWYLKSCAFVAPCSLTHAPRLERTAALFKNEKLFFSFNTCAVSSLPSRIFERLADTHRQPSVLSLSLSPSLPPSSFLSSDLLYHRPLCGLTHTLPSFLLSFLPQNQLPFITIV